MAQARLTEDDYKLIERGLENLLADEREGVLRFWREYIVVKKDGTKFAGNWDDIVRIVGDAPGPQGGYNAYLSLASQVGDTLARLRKVMRLSEVPKPAVGVVKPLSKRR